MVSNLAPERAAGASLRPPVRVASPATLITPDGLASVLGPLHLVERSLLSTPGKSGSSLESVRVRLASGQERRLILKRTRLREDMVARRTGAVDREGLLLADSALAGVWDAFHRPHIAFATTPDDAALLMEDLSDYLVPEAETPISETDEDAVLASLATLHARFWNAPELSAAWLFDPSDMLELMSAASAEQEIAGGTADGSGASSEPNLYDWMRQGWAALRERAPRDVTSLLSAPRERFALACQALPRTLVHGDARLVNFALLPPDRVARVAAFDWQLVGAGPCTVDLGFYLIGNARRRARPADACIARYRTFLQNALGAALPDSLWHDLVRAGILFGAATLLWDRVLDVIDDLPGAQDEWDWWVEALR